MLLYLKLLTKGTDHCKNYSIKLVQIYEKCKIIRSVIIDALDVLSYE